MPEEEIKDTLDILEEEELKRKDETVANLTTKTNL